MWTSGKKFFWSRREGRRERLPPFLLSCARATSKSPLLALKKSAPRTLVCYAAVSSVVVLLPGALRDDTKRLCSRLLVLRLYYRKWLANKRPGRLFNFKGSSGGVYHVGGVYFYNCITLTSSTKLVCFRRKLQESSKIVELMRLGRLEIHTAHSNSHIDFRILA